MRTVLAKDQTVGSIAKLDKPTLTSEIFVKFTGSGNFTYNFPFGTNFASLAGNYDLDETLTIALVPDEQKPKLVVQTLPNGGNFGDRPPDRVVTPSVVDPQSRLDAIVSQETIVNAIKNLPR